MRYLLIGLALAISCAAFAAEEPSEEPAYSVSADVGYASKYVWRGLVLNPDAVMQPSITVAHSSGLSLNFWASMDTTSFNGTKGEIVEHDYTLDYAWKCREVDLNVGYIYYAYPDASSDSTSEIYGVACFGGMLSPSLAANYDVDEAKGLYIALSAGYECPTAFVKSAPTVLNLTARVGFATAKHNNYNFGADKTGFVDGTIGASAPFEMGQFTLTPSITYSRVLDSALRNTVTHGDNWVFGVGLSREF